MVPRVPLSTAMGRKVLSGGKQKRVSPQFGAIRRSCRSLRRRSAHAMLDPIWCLGGAQLS